MPLAKTYDPRIAEPQLQAYWQEAGTYQFAPTAGGQIYAIDTPPPTVSGNLHMGHVYSYSHTDFMARFWRMSGYNVFYPMGYDDNGLPTERLVEKTRHVRATEVGRREFIRICLEVSEETEEKYQALWRRAGLSVDWRYSYRSIDDLSRRTSQWSFLDLYRKGLAYQQEAPAIWCPECRTAIAQAELNDIERESTFYTLSFELEAGGSLAIATTRPELLPACVAVFVHPDDARFTALVGQQAIVPLFGQRVPILADSQVDPDKGTGAVMCCTFGDATDVEWWRTYRLPLRVVIGRDGRMTAAAGEYAGLTAAEARSQIVMALQAQGILLDRRAITQSVRVHERCDTPVEYIVVRQWFVRVLDFKSEFLAAGEQVTWHPPSMGTRYREWVENLRWDWGISRQRYFGVPFPVWYCDACGTIMTASEDELPVDPTERKPAQPCSCGSTSFRPDEDVMDTWATSALSPQIVGQWLTNPALYQQVFPFALRPQAHEIIRTWAFYTIVKSIHHFATLPWRDVAISGWGLAPEGTGKISKSRGGGPIAPDDAFAKYSTDAVRYWAASTGFGKDSTISEDKMQVGAKLVTKLWNVARFGERFLEGFEPPSQPPTLTPTDRWIVSRLERLIQRVTELFHGYDYAAAKSEVEGFFWTVLTDNYLEMVKARLYGGVAAGRESAQYALYKVLLAVFKLFAPFLPHVTEKVYQSLFAPTDGSVSIHRSHWPTFEETLVDAQAEGVGDSLVAIATAVRRYKSEHSLGLGSELPSLHLATADPDIADLLRVVAVDIQSVTRAQRVEISAVLPSRLQALPSTGAVDIALQLEAQSQ